MACRKTENFQDWVCELLPEDVTDLLQDGAEILGEGAHAIAFLVKWGNDVAVLKKAVSPSAKKFFKDEAAKMYALDGAGGIPKVLGYCPKPPAILQSFRGKLTLNHLLSEDNLICQYDLIQLGLLLGEKILEMNTKGLAHNDIKEDNIMIQGPSSRPEVSLIDLGLACEIGKSCKVSADCLHEDFPWMAPEVCRGFRTTKNSDTYSFGFVLMELIKEAPGDHPEVTKLAKKAMTKRRTDRPSLPHLLREFREIIS
ncbi:serine/threonine/tyrosine-protein kinase HT1-like [Homarus americanus]|uniref:serine/threonine/tyrosine-protein kinase HT1-like n=1 Tax=Homarus americanus TaxID=6706 RepID=UPI001C44C930|nr:serine/threonine/tyrosine-protein kinase HT1-like [Homarus americanus]